MTFDKDDHHDDHGLGFSHDLPRMIGRRRLLGVMGGLGVAAAASPASALECVALSWETQGPFPADGSNSREGQVLNVLTQEGVIRQDLRTSFGDYSGTADGPQLDLELTLVGADGCTPLAGHAIYLWHCDVAGEYSLYNVTDQNFLRGVGVSDESGLVKFTTVFPGCYSGRWPHLHFEIFENAEAAVAGEASVLTSQIALPLEVCQPLYANDARFTGSTENLSRLTLQSDNIFGDNSEAEVAQQTLAMSGDADAGFHGTLTIPVDFNADRSVSMGPGGPGGPPPEGMPPGGAPPPSN
ncbi:hypothetical protein [Paracoccus albus]|uniref:dioxygenase family protein n=1 Tax=Paracoccus albus TaxID=3017784 RepID=UPI0022F094E7|nr:hypothetical protein [Paracoccus albus]WBU59506.1 hypothetical protein PAF20_12125 [Paracoccus albus]